MIEFCGPLTAAQHHTARRKLGKIRSKMPSDASQKRSVIKGLAKKIVSAHPDAYGVLHDPGKAPLTTEQITILRKSLSQLKPANQNQAPQPRNEVSSWLDWKSHVIKNLVNDPEFGPQNAVENWHQLLATYAAYGKKPAKGVELSALSKDIGAYHVDEVIENTRGLRILVLTPTEPGQPPIMAIRGTKFTAYGNILDDLGPTIGSRAFEKSKARIREKLIEITEKHGPAVICGHSLGGAIAQLITTEFCDLTIRNNDTGDEFSAIQACKHYGAPGVGKEKRAIFEEKRQQQKRRFNDRTHRTEVLGFRHAQDIIPLFGGKHLTDRFWQYGTLGDYKGWTAAINAHTGGSLLAESERLKFEFKPSHDNSLMGRVIKYFGEPIRWVLGILAKHFLLPKARLQKRTKARIRLLVRDLTIFLSNTRQLPPVEKNPPNFFFLADHRRAKTPFTLIETPS